MNSGRGEAEIVTVIRTGQFQEPLRQAASVSRPWRHKADRHLSAVLAWHPADPATVATLIDGNVTGYLSQDVASRDREQLDELGRSGQYLVCSALIVEAARTGVSASGFRSSPASEHAGLPARSPPCREMIDRDGDRVLPRAWFPLGSLVFLGDLEERYLRAI